MFGGVAASILLKGPFVHLKEFTEADKEKLKDIISRMHERAKYGLSTESEEKELIVFYEGMVW